MRLGAGVCETGALSAPCLNVSWIFVFPGRACVCAGVHPSDHWDENTHWTHH